MNKDLMMKAAIQFKGKWPVDGDNALVYVSTQDKFHTAINFSIVTDVCTREQFESFVESLFDGAPEGAEYYSAREVGVFAEAWFKQNVHGKWDFKLTSSGGWHTLSPQSVIGERKLIKRPAKKAPIIGDTPEQLKDGVTPKAPYMPKVGEWCLLLDDYVLCGNSPLKMKKGDTVIVKAVVDLGYGEVALITDENINGSGTIIFSGLRPLRTERELFIEKAATAYLRQVGSNAVDKKWFGRIFGALHDDGFEAP